MTCSVPFCVPDSNHFSNHLSPHVTPIEIPWTMKNLRKTNLGERFFVPYPLVGYQSSIINHWALPLWKNQVLVTQCKLSEDDLVLSLGFCQSGVKLPKKYWTFWKGAYEGVAFTIYFKETDIAHWSFCFPWRTGWITLPPVLAYLPSSNTKGGPSLDWCPGLQIWRNPCHLWGFCNPSFLGVEYPITNANCKPFSLLVWQSLEVSWSFWKDSEKGGVTAVDRGLVISMALCMDVLMKSSYS